MVPTYVFDWPTGEEKGDFLALDLGESVYTCYRPNLNKTY